MLSLGRRRIIVLVLFVFLLIVFALPFRVESVHSTLYTTILGRSARATPSVHYYNAYQETQVLPLQFFFYLTLFMLYFGRKKIWGTLSVISSTLNALTLFVIHFSLTFHLNFFGPKITMEAGVGFYALCLLCVILFLFSIVSWFYMKKSATKINYKDPLDTDI